MKPVLICQQLLSSDRLLGLLWFRSTHTAHYAWHPLSVSDSLTHQCPTTYTYINSQHQRIPNSELPTANFQQRIANISTPYLHVLSQCLNITRTQCQHPSNVHSYSVPSSTAQYGSPPLSNTFLGLLPSNKERATAALTAVNHSKPSPTGILTTDPPARPHGTAGDKAPAGWDSSTTLPATSATERRLAPSRWSP